MAAVVGIKKSKSKPSVHVKSQPALTLADIAMLLCEYAKQRNVEEHQGDGRHEGNSSHGINALSARAAAEGITIGPTAIKGLLGENPTENPRMKSTLKPMASLLALWNVKHPKTGERVIYTAEQLQTLHKKTHKSLLGREVRLRIEIKKLIDSATEKQLVSIYSFLVGNTDSIDGGNFMAAQKNKFLEDANGSKRDLESLILSDDTRYVAIKLHMILLQDKSHVDIEDNKDYIRDLLGDSTIDLTLIPPEEIELKIDELAAIAGEIENNRLPSDDVESCMDLIILLGLYAEKPYEEKEENKVAQFLQWIGLPSDQR
jgi:hypothetical protein